MLKIHLLSYLRIASILFATCLILPSCTGHHEEGHDHEGHEGHEHAAHHHDEDGEHEGHEGHEGEDGEIHLSAHQLEKLSVGAEEVTLTDFHEVIKVTGEIVPMPGAEGIVSARQSGIVKINRQIRNGQSVKAGQNIATVSPSGMTGGDPDRIARAEYEAAVAELERITPLHADGIVSTKEYNAVVLRVKQAKLSLAGNGTATPAAALSPINGVVTSLDVVDGQYVEAGQQIARISSADALALRADLPVRYLSEASDITWASFRLPYSDELIEITGTGNRITSAAASSGSDGGYLPLYFNIPAGTTSVVNGSFCEIYLYGRSAGKVLTVKESGISEQQGKFFVYIEHEPGHYQKRAVVTGRSDGKNVEILSGLQPGERVVTDGMTFVKLAETSGAVPEGHSHSH